MNYRMLLSILFVSMALIILPGVASADTAFTTGNVNLRTGPGTSYARVATLERGVRVEVLTCEANWCRIGRQGISGWMSANFLEWTGARRPAVIVRPTIVVRPPYHGVRPPHYYRPRPPRPDRPRPPRPGRPTCRIAPGYSCR